MGQIDSEQTFKLDTLQRSLRKLGRKFWKFTERKSRSCANIRTTLTSDFSTGGSNAAWEIKACK